jgi:hypothetical protein
VTSNTHQLLLPEGTSTPLTAEVARYGAIDLETGGFLLAPASDPMRVSGLAMAGEQGIVRRRGIFHVSGVAIDRLFGWADRERLRIPAQFHSHGTEAFLSETDRRDGFNVTDFISTVVPHYVKPPTDPGTWGWWIYTGNDWIDLRPPIAVAGALQIVVFDEDGVRGFE